MIYLIGQRIIVDGEIVTVIRNPNKPRDVENFDVWVKFADGLVQWRDPANTQPLPNGQL